MFVKNKRALHCVYCSYLVFWDKMQRWRGSAAVHKLFTRSEVWKTWASKLDVDQLIPAEQALRCILCKKRLFCTMYSGLSVSLCSSERVLLLCYAFCQINVQFGPWGLLKVWPCTIQCRKKSEFGSFIKNSNSRSDSALSELVIAPLRRLLRSILKTRRTFKV